MAIVLSGRPRYNLGYFAAAVRGISVIGWGKPGVGKSAYVAAYAKAMGYDFHQFLPSHHIPEDIAGTPVVYREEKHVKSLPFDFMQRLEIPYGWMSLDEYNTGSAMMRAVLLQLTNERTIGGKPIHPTSIITALANPVEYAPNASPLEPSVANRFMHWNWTTPVEDILAGFGNGLVYPVPEVVKFENCELGDFAWGRKGQLFHQSMPEFLETLPNNDEMAYATPRSWHMLFKALSALDSVQAPATEYALVAQGCVGKTAAAMFMEFATKLDLFNAVKVMEGTEKVDFKVSIDRLVHLPSALIFHAQRLKREDSLTTDHIDNAFAVMLEMGEMGHIDVVKQPMAAISHVLPGYQCPQPMRVRFGSLMRQIMAPVAN